MKVIIFCYSFIINCQYAVDQYIGMLMFLYARKGYHAL
jgi:hypothetical protein